MIATTVRDGKRRGAVDALPQAEETYECYQCLSRFEQHHAIRLQGETWRCDNVKRCGVGWWSWDSAPTQDAYMHLAIQGRVVHCRREPYDIYIGRENRRYGLPQSPWANPFIVGTHGTRDEVIARFDDWIPTQPQLLAALPTEIAGKVLGCWCVPQACHGDVLIRLAAIAASGS